MEDKSSPSPPTLQINTSQDGTPQEKPPTTPTGQPTRELSAEKWGHILKEKRRNRDSGNL